MKDIKDLLDKSRAPKPGRPLGADFTRRVMQAITEPPKQRPWWARYLHIRPFSALSKPILALLVLAVVAAAGGSVYAVVSNWPKPSAKLHKVITLSSGNRIVAIDIKNCASEVQPPDGSIKVDGPRTKYYEIKKDSKLTNEQVVDMVQTICEETIAEHALNNIIRQRYGDLGKGTIKTDTPNIASRSGIVVKAITDKMITFGYDPAWFDDAQPALRPDTGTYYDWVVPEDVTFSRLAPDLQVFDRDQAIAYTDLRPGDSVKVVFRDEHPVGSESDPNDPDHWDNPEKIIIEAIVRTKPTSPPMQFYRLLGGDFVRVEPCKESSTGFCRAYEFIKDDFTTGLRLEPQQ